MHEPGAKRSFHVHTKSRLILTQNPLLTISHTYMNNSKNTCIFISVAYSTLSRSSMFSFVLATCEYARDRRSRWVTFSVQLNFLCIAPPPSFPTDRVWTQLCDYVHSYNTESSAAFAVRQVQTRRFFIFELRVVVYMVSLGRVYDKYFHMAVLRVVYFVCVCVWFVYTDSSRCMVLTS